MCLETTYYARELSHNGSPHLCLIVIDATLLPLDSVTKVILARVLANSPCARTVGTEMRSDQKAQRG